MRIILQLPGASTCWYALPAHARRETFTATDLLECIKQDFCYTSKQVSEMHLRVQGVEIFPLHPLSNLLKEDEVVCLITEESQFSKLVSLRMKRKANFSKDEAVEEEEREEEEGEQEKVNEGRKRKRIAYIEGFTYTAAMSENENLVEAVKGRDGDSSKIAEKSFQRLEEAKNSTPKRESPAVRYNLRGRGEAANESTQEVTTQLTPIADIKSQPKASIDISEMRKAIKGKRQQQQTLESPTTLNGTTMTTIATTTTTTGAEVVKEKAETPKKSSKLEASKNPKDMTKEDYDKFFQEYIEMSLRAVKKTPKTSPSSKSVKV